MKNVTRVYYPEHGFDAVISDFIAFVRKSDIDTADPTMDELDAMAQQQRAESAELTLRATGYESYQHDFVKRQASRYDRFQSALGQVRSRYRKNRPMLALLARFKRRAKKATDPAASTSAPANGTPPAAEKPE